MTACAPIKESWSAPSVAVESIIDKIGQRSFFSDLSTLLYDLCGADHTAILRYGTDELYELDARSLDGSKKAHERVSRYLKSQSWRVDPAFIELQEAQAGFRQLSVRVNLDALPRDIHHQFYRDIRDRILVCGYRDGAIYCLSLLRSENSAAFSSTSVGKLMAVSDTLLSSVAKHMEVDNNRPHMALTSLPHIEHTILTDGHLSQRESEVCARILYGISSPGIALDLDIGVETVKTYRNRAYLRLGIGSPRELLVWYLSIWGSPSLSELSRIQKTSGGSLPIR